MSLLRSSMVAGAGAVASRLLGFVRDVLIAGLFGATPVADALLAALRIPNLLRRVLAEGGLNGGFVPIYHRRLREGGREAADAFASRAVGLTLLASLAMVGLAMLAGPWLILAFAPGYAADGLLTAQAASYLRAALPFLLFAMMSALVVAWLNAERRVAAGAVATVAMNGALVLVLLWLGRNAVGGEPANAAWSFAAAWSLAGLVQLVIVLAAARRLGFRRRHVLPRLDADQRRLLAATPAALAAAGSVQFILASASMAASFTPGAVAWLYYAERVVQLPLGFIAVAVGTVLLPELARDAARDSAGGGLSVRALELALALAMPAAAALLVLAGPIVSVLFEHGRFGPADARASAALMAGLAPGLVAAAAGQVLLQTWLAREAARVPLLTLLAGIVVAPTSALSLAPILGPAGFGLGVSLGLAVQAALLLAGLMRGGGWTWPAGMTGNLARLGLSSAAMAAAVAWGAMVAAPWLDAANPVILRAGTLAVLCVSGIGLYGAMAALLGVVRVRRRPPACEPPPRLP